MEAIQHSPPPHLQPSLTKPQLSPTPPPTPSPQRASLSALVAIGCYDLLQSSRFDAQRGQLARDYRTWSRLALAAEAVRCGGEGSEGVAEAQQGGGRAAFEEDDDHET
jgi:hypothetical protein